jgi:hypothetical protein
MVKHEPEPRPLEGVQTCPVCRQVDRLKDVNTDRRAGGIENERRIAKTGTQPASTSRPLMWPFNQRPSSPAS